MIAGVIFSNNQWTFWDVFLLFFVFIPLLMLWFFCMIDVIRRLDLSGWAKALWVLAIIIFPWIGTLVYVIVRPWGPQAPGYGYYTDPYGYPYGDPYAASRYSGGYRPPVTD